VSASAKDGTKMRRVLVVDDEEPIRLVVSAILEEEGYLVEVGTNGEALAMAATQPPDLVLLDIMMPVMDGPEVRRHLLEDPRTADIPVVVMTAAGDAAGWARRLGAAGALAKPFDMDQLIDLVERVVGSAP
jgi:two-component system, chemotaxis family, chemotaxis protein CheY